MRWPPTRVQQVAAAVGVVIALTGAATGGVGSLVLRFVGYPLACAALPQWVPIVRERRLQWFVAHQLGMAAIVAGWALTDRTGGVVVNGAWFVIAAGWYVLGGRQTASE